MTTDGGRNPGRGERLEGAGKCKGQPIPASSPVALAALALLTGAAAAFACR